MSRPARLPDPDERVAWLRLARTPRSGPVTLRQAVATYGSAAAALDALPERARRRGLKPLAFPSRSAVQREVEALEGLQAELLLAIDPQFPPYLAALDPAPPLLIVRGDKELFERPAVAMVGSRNASAVGRRMAKDLAAGLGAKGFVVVSGLARGIDGECHQAALSTGTIAVIAGGIDTVYPPEHKDLQRLIAEQGLVATESPLGHRPTAKDFPRRNRLVTGLALGVVIVEAAERSGTLISARCAADQGREVMAVPGSPLDPRARGANQIAQARRNPGRNRGGRR